MVGYNGEPGRLAGPAPPATTQREDGPVAFAPAHRLYTLQMLLLVGLCSAGALLVSQWPWLAHAGISPLIIGITLGIVFAHTVRGSLPEQCSPGILFSGKTLLRVAIVLYGFRITFQDIAEVGFAAFVVSCVMMVSTFVLGTWAGMRWFGLDRDTALLSSAGSAVCGAAAVVAVESVLRAEPYKAAVAIGTVVCFGTIAMVVMPMLHGAHWLDLPPEAWGVYVGGTVHEVAQVVAVGHALGEQAANDAVIVKMTRVMLLAPALLLMVWWLGQSSAPGGSARGGKAPVPWFAIGFLLVAGVNSLHVVPPSWVAAALQLDTFLLTMAMVALGMETHYAKVRRAGAAPIYHGLFLFVWLVAIGYLVTDWAARNLCRECLI